MSYYSDDEDEYVSRRKKYKRMKKYRNRNNYRRGR